MRSELITSWAEHDTALREIILMASRCLKIFDEDLSKLKLEGRENAEQLRRLLAADRKNSLSIVLRNAEPLRRESARLMKLLADFPQQMSVSQCPPHLAPASASLCLADDRHALIRFDKKLARARIIIDSPQQSMPYGNQFRAIVEEGGEQISATTLGL